jgi:predicted peptidase
MELVDYVVSEYQIDDDRVILTGHSLGSMGAWHFAEQAPNRWAAVIPVSSRCLTGMDKMLESDTPIWAICSNWDVSDNIRGMKNNTEKLLEANPDREVRYTVFENYSHNDMAEVPYTAKFFDWAAEKHR